MSEESVGKIVIAKTRPGDVYGIGEVIGYCDAPTYTIQVPGKGRFSWRTDLCTPVDEDCETCKGRGHVLPEPTGNLNHDLTPVPCPVCSEL